MADRPPAFQFYPRDFLTDEKVIQMSNTEVGRMMRRLLTGVANGVRESVTPYVGRFVGRVVWNDRRCQDRPAIPRVVRDAVYRRDEGRCRQCSGAERLEFDHVIAYSKGGPSTVANLQLLCKRCNRSKGAR